EAQPQLVDAGQHLFLVDDNGARQRNLPAVADEVFEAIDGFMDVHACAPLLRRCLSGPTTLAGTNSVMSPPNSASSLIKLELRNRWRRLVGMKTVVTSGSSRRFISAIWHSLSKSDTARSPRTMTRAPTWRAKSQVRPLQRRHRLGATVLDDEQCLVAQRGAVQRLERGGQGHALTVGWVNKKKVVGAEVGGGRPQPLHGVGADHVALLGEAGCDQILGHDSSTASVAFHKCCPRGAARECLDAKRAGAGEQIQYTRTAYAVADDIEQGLAHQRRGGPHRAPRRGLEETTTTGPRRDARGRSGHLMSKAGHAGAAVGRCKGAAT